MCKGTKYLMTSKKNWAIGRWLFKLVLDIGHVAPLGVGVEVYLSCSILVTWAISWTEESSYHRGTIEKPLVDATSTTVVSIITERQGP